jgi:hypothetical protein
MYFVLVNQFIAQTSQVLNNLSCRKNECSTGPGPINCTEYSWLVENQTLEKIISIVRFSTLCYSRAWCLISWQK